jgi:hypothetical protein
VSKIRPSLKAASFTESVIREMTRLSVAHGAITLSQGFPDSISLSDARMVERGVVSSSPSSGRRGAPGFVNGARLPASTLKP